MAAVSTSKTASRKFVIEGVILYDGNEDKGPHSIGVKAYVEGKDMIEAIRKAYKEIKHNLTITEVREFLGEYVKTDAVGFVIGDEEEEEEDDV